MLWHIRAQKDDIWGATYVLNLGVRIFACPCTDRMLPTRLIDRDVLFSVTRSIKRNSIQNMPLYCLVLGVGSVGNIFSR
jgi:hypothetical protein